MRSRLRMLAEGGGGGVEAAVGNGENDGGEGGGGGGSSCSCADDVEWTSNYGDCSTCAVGGANEGYCAGDGADGGCRDSCGTCICAPAGPAEDGVDFDKVYLIGVPIILLCCVPPPAVDSSPVPCRVRPSTRHRVR